MNCEPSFVCHSDPQGAVFRSLRRRDLLLNRGIAHKRDTEDCYAFIIASVPVGPLGSTEDANVSGG